VALKGRVALDSSMLPDEYGVNSIGVGATKRAEKSAHENPRLRDNCHIEIKKVVCQTSRNPQNRISVDNEWHVKSTKGYIEPITPKPYCKLQNQAKLFKDLPDLMVYICQQYYLFSLYLASSFSACEKSILRHPRLTAKCFDGSTVVFRS
jgi:hypothetical protein